MTRAFPRASIRTHVALPLRLMDGSHFDSRVYSFIGLVDGREHVAIGLGSRAGR